MSSIKLSPNASGTGIFTIAAPNSNTDRTLTLPDQTGTVLTNAGPFTANASASAGAVTIDASNNVGIGTSSPANFGASFKSLQVDGSSYGLVQASSGTVIAEMMGSSASSLGFVGTRSNHAFVLRTNDTERARIDTSGNLLVNTTSSYVSGSSARVQIAYPKTSQWAFFIRPTDNNTGGGGPVLFQNLAGTTIGSISADASNVAYNTSSDYRLKYDIAPMTGALARVALLKPCTYKWKVDDSSGEGFIAHELAEVCPRAVSGEKDAVDAEGNIVPQGIDTSFLVATLTAAIQEQQALIESLTARIAALEAQP